MPAGLCFGQRLDCDGRSAVVAAITEGDARARAVVVAAIVVVAIVAGRRGDVDGGRLTVGLSVIGYWRGVVIGTVRRAVVTGAPCRPEGQAQGETEGTTAMAPVVVAV